MEREWIIYQILVNAYKLFQDFSRMIKDMLSFMYQIIHI